MWPHNQQKIKISDFLDHLGDENKGLRVGFIREKSSVVS